MKRTLWRALAIVGLLSSFLVVLPAAASVAPAPDAPGSSNGTVLIPASTVNPTRVTQPGIYYVIYQTVVRNDGSTPAYNVAVTYTLDSSLTFVAMQADSRDGTVFIPIGTVYIPTTSWQASEVRPGEAITLTLVAFGTASQYQVVRTTVQTFNGGTGSLQLPLDTVIAIYKIYLPLIEKG
jgi:uncharacterized repeat protein (TIGR01451 family)